MKQFATAFVAICSIAVTLRLTDGAAVSPEILLDPKEKQLFDNLLPQDLNLTEIKMAIDADHPHAYLNVPEIIRLYEYEAESHEVVTSDGHILTMHRITGNKTSRSSVGKPVVFLMHGLLCSSVDWVIAGPERGFAFLLADAGYDVWMGNARGNKYSRAHEYLTPDDEAYWGFSWHQIGEIDLPTMIDHVLATTGREKLTYVGHSQGSTTFFVMLSEHPKYNTKINAMFSLAPVAYCSNMVSPVFQFLSRTPVRLISKLIGMYEFQPTTLFFNQVKSLVCTTSEIMQSICRNAMFLFTGFNKEQFDMSLLPAILAHIPAGSAVDQLLHYAQMIKSGKFRKYDYGIIKNWKMYRAIKPPTYNLMNVRVPVSLHYSANDWLSDGMDVEKLYSQLPNPIGRFRVPNDKFNHIDFLWAKDVKTLLYYKIMNLMKRYED